MAELAKRPLYKHKGLSKDHQHPRKMPGLALRTYNLSAGEGEVSCVCVGKHVLEFVYTWIHLHVYAHTCGGQRLTRWLGEGFLTSLDLIF